MSIRAIDKGAVHRICSGQVVLDLATAVKELVENSMDAGATVVEVVVRDNGLEGFEVSDNGCGIDPANYEAIGAPPTFRHCLLLTVLPAHRTETLHEQASRV